MYFYYQLLETSCSVVVGTNNIQSLSVRMYSAAKQQQQEPDDKTPLTNQKQQLSKRDRLKQAIKDYGTTVLIFHITISLVSLGFFYLLVSSGLDLPQLLQKFGLGQNLLENQLAQGLSTFAIAYAVHKVFAPLRIGITLSIAPLLVKCLRSVRKM